jgi:hypothetical protein
MGVYAHRKDANKVRDYLGAGHFVTEYEVKESIENNKTYQNGNKTKLQEVD